MYIIHVQGTWYILYVLLFRYIKIILLLGRHDYVKAIIGMYNIIYDPNTGTYFHPFLLSNQIYESMA